MIETKEQVKNNTEEIQGNVLGFGIKKRELRKNSICDKLHFFATVNIYEIQETKDEIEYLTYQTLAFVLNIFL